MSRGIVLAIVAALAIAVAGAIVLRDLRSLSEVSPAPAEAVPGGGAGDTARPEPN